MLNVVNLMTSMQGSMYLGKNNGGGEGKIDWTRK